MMKRSSVGRITMVVVPSLLLVLALCVGGAQNARNTELFSPLYQVYQYIQSYFYQPDQITDEQALYGAMKGVVQQLEGGFNTPLTSSGAPLSGNQQRLVCIARSVVSRPGLLLIDGTLDQLPDEQLMPLLNYLFDEAMPWTLVIASSRTEIIRRCSRHLDLGQHASTRTGGPTP